jgi:hypothetical protein
LLSNKEILSQFFEAIRNDILREHVAQGQVASGKTIESFEYTVDNFKGVLVANSYVGVLEYGRKPGKVPENFRGVILEWMQAKGIFQDKDNKAQGRIAYFISRKIAKEGTQLYKKGGNSGVLSKAINEKRINSLIESLASKYQSEVMSDVLAEFK